MIGITQQVRIKEKSASNFIRDTGARKIDETGRRQEINKRKIFYGDREESAMLL